MAGDWTGRFLVGLTWGLLLSANYLTATHIFGKWFKPIPNVTSHNLLSYYSFYTPLGTVLFIIYQLLNLFALICHIRAVLGNPGTTKSYISRTPPATFTSPRICKPCGHRWKPPRAHHCRKCGLCVFRMDHHCAWIDNCVGIFNQKFFILFLVYTAILCTYQLLLLFISLLFWVSHHRLTYSFFPAFSWIFLSVESTAFLYMTTDFFSEQLESLETNSTLVESHQHTHGTQKHFWEHVSEVFGTYSLMWLVPTAPRLHLDFTEPVFLDKAVADQLRVKQRRFEEHSKRQYSGIEKAAAIIATTGEFPLRNRRPDPRPEEPTLPPKGLVESQLKEWPEIRKNNEDAKSSVMGTNYISTGFYKEWEGLNNGAKKNLFSDIPINHDDDNGEEDLNFKNVYIKPQADIGVELDDESRFIRLEDLQEYEEDSSELEEYSNEDELEEHALNVDFKTKEKCMNYNGKNEFSIRSSKNS